MNKKCSICLTGLRENHSTQHALLKMIETWKTKPNLGQNENIIYMD